MSELEKAIDQKLADARKQSEVTESSKKAEEKIKKEPGSEGDDKKVEEFGKGKEDLKSRTEEPNEVASDSASKKDVQRKDSDDRKDRQSCRSGGDRRDDSKEGSSRDSRRTVASDRRDDRRRGSGYDRRDDYSRNRTREEHDDRLKGTSNRDREEDRNGTRLTRNDETSKNRKEKNAKGDVTINDGVEWDITRNYGTSNDDIGAAVKKEPSEDWHVLSEDHEDTFQDKKTRTSQDKEKSRDRSVTPPWSTRRKNVRSYQSDRRSPPRRRSRSRERSRRRSRSPVRNRSRSPRYRRSPSSHSRSYRAPARRYSPRRSRSPVRRRSRSRSRISSDRSANPKALLAKKSFLDDLAVKFAQEGKEFPELEQYRCEINSQFSSGSSHMPRSMDLVSACVGGPYGQPVPPAMGMTMMGRERMYDVSYPMVAPDYVVDTPPLVAYPIVSPAPGKPSPPMVIPLENIMASVHAKNPTSSSIETIMPENKVAVSDLLISQQSNLGSQPEHVPEKGFVWRGDAKTRISQAIELLDDMEHAVRRSGKFMYRSQTYYENNIDDNRSPILQGPNNPRYSLNNPPGESNDPFGNIPKNIKPVIKTLCLDEGKISEHIFLRTRKQQLALTLKKKKQQMEERKKRAMAVNMPKAQLQKTTQTDPTVCTECLIRKLKFRATVETQTAPILTTDSVVQTNPMPVQTVSEFGSITELTPNQVRAVSELIRYIKLTATTGSVEEMRHAMITNQMYSVNGDLRTAYQYFDAMVEHKNKNRVVTATAPPPPKILEAIEEPPIKDIIYEDDIDGTNEENWDDDVEIDEYEQYHKTFGGDTTDGASYETGLQHTTDQYQDPKSSFKNNPLAPYSYGTKQHAGGLRGRGAAAAGRGKFTQPRGGRGRGFGKKNARGGKPKAPSWI